MEPDSNQQQAVLETAALPIELPTYKNRFLLYNLYGYISKERLLYFLMKCAFTLVWAELLLL